MITKEREIIEFFNKCKENKQKLIHQKNNLIDKLLRIKKNGCTSKEEWLNYRDEWNKKRIETADEKNRRECEEMLNEIKEEKIIVQEMTLNMLKVKTEIEEILKNGKMNEIQKEMNMRIDKLEKYVKQQKNSFSFPSNSNTMNRNECDSILSLSEITQLEEWTEKKCGEIVFNSEKDNWSEKLSVFDSKVLNKSNLAFVVEDTNNNIFGYYFNGEITKLNGWMKANGSFAFSLKSNGRIHQPMKFDEKEKCSGLYIHDNYETRLFYPDSLLYFFKENKKNQCEIKEASYLFDFNGLENVFFESSGEGGWVKFNPKRIVVIQFV